MDLDSGLPLLPPAKADADFGSNRKVVSDAEDTDSEELEEEQQQAKLIASLQHENQTLQQVPSSAPDSSHLPCWPAADVLVLCAEASGGSEGDSTTARQGVP